jgi:membrane protein CcdC involved in cytochrome C biogenesis
LIIGSLYLILGACVIANILAGIYFNVKTLKFKFDREKFFLGLSKAIMVAIVLLLLIVPITFVPYILDHTAIQLPDDVSSYMSILAVAGILLATALKYFKDATAKLIKILNITEEEKIALIKKEKANVEQPKPTQPEEPKSEEATEIVR